MWYGERVPVTLNVDLTRYHSHLKPGMAGTLVPNLKCSMYGWQDRFGAVEFDCCGTTMDIVLSNLTIHRDGKEGAPPDVLG